MVCMMSIYGISYLYTYIYIYMTQCLVLPPPPEMAMVPICISRLWSCVYTYVVCVCANAYSMYMYVYMHTPVYPSLPVDVVGGVGGWRGGVNPCGGGVGDQPTKKKIMGFRRFFMGWRSYLIKNPVLLTKTWFSEKLTENSKRAFDSSTRFSQGFGWCSTVPPWWSCRVTQVASNTAFPHCQPPPKGTGHMDSLRRRRDLEGHWWLIRMKDTN